MKALSLPGRFVLACVLIVAATIAYGLGCAALKTACLVVNLADQVCTTLVLADGTEVPISRDDAASPAKFEAALKRGGSVGCKP